MKITRRQLRKIIKEAIQLEQFTDYRDREFADFDTNLEVESWEDDDWDDFDIDNDDWDDLSGDTGDWDDDWVPGDPTPGNTNEGIK